MSTIYTVDLSSDVRYVAFTSWHRNGVLELTSHAVDLSRESDFLRHGETPTWLGYCVVCAMGVDIQRMDILPDNVNVWEILDSHGLVCECD